MEIARFEKNGTEFVVAFDEKLTVTAKGNTATAEAHHSRDHGWLYSVYNHAFAKALGAKGSTVYIRNESAEQARALVDAKMEEERRILREKEAAEIAAIKNGEKTIKLGYYDGEYLSSHTAHGVAASLLISLGVAKDISGWGVSVDSRLVAALGTEFTYAQVVEFVRPEMEAKERAAAERRAARQAKFDEAKTTGKPVVIRTWTDDCDDPHEECSLDRVTEYAMPDGTTKTERRHTW